MKNENIKKIERDTVSQLLTWSCYLLAKNEKYFEKLNEEIKQVIGNSIEEIEYDVMKDLPLMKACLDEALRLYPPVPVETVINQIQKK